MDDRNGTILGLFELTERRCGAIEESSAMMHELMARCREYNGKGSLTITFSVSCDKDNEEAMKIDIRPKVSMPDKPRRTALVFHDPKHKKLSRTDPRQMEMLEERQERERELSEQGIARIGRGAGE